MFLHRYLTFHPFRQMRVMYTVKVTYAHWMLGCLNLIDSGFLFLLQFISWNILAYLNDYLNILIFVGFIFIPTIRPRDWRYIDSIKMFATFRQNVEECLISMKAWINLCMSVRLFLFTVTMLMVKKSKVSALNKTKTIGNSRGHCVRAKSI